MQARKTPRLERIRLLMLLSLLVLAGFLGYWLHGEYIHERESLRNDLSRTLNSVQSRQIDSLIMRAVIRPIVKTVDVLSKDGIIFSDVSPGNIRGRIRSASDSNLPCRQIPAWRDSLLKSFDLNTDSFMRALANARDSFSKNTHANEARLLQGGMRMEKIMVSAKRISPDSYVHYSRNVVMQAADSAHAALFQEDSTRRDSMDAKLVRGIELMIQTMSDLHGGPSKTDWRVDTGTIREEFQRMLAKSGIAGNLHWTPDSLIKGTSVLRLDDSTSPGYTAFVTSYEPNLIKRTGPQLLFSLFLICLTALAFGLTFRALRSQMQLATLRNDFISNMSHELKTPVSTVKVALEAVAEPAVLGNPALAGEYLEMAGLELGRLELLINQALQTALLEEGRLAVERQPLDLARLSAQMLRIMQPRFSQQGGRITLFEEGESFIVNGDSLHLQGLIINMLDNALKYAGPEPRVRMELRELQHSIRLRISDRGPGIPAQYRAKVFDKFFRVPKGNEHSVKGYGLGLAYCAQIVRMLDGALRVSETPGGGCSFDITLPKQTS